VPYRERRKQRQHSTDDEEHHAGDDRHVIAGDRQHVSKARDIHGLVYWRRDRIALAGDQGGRDRTGIARHRSADAAVYSVTDAFDESRVAQPQAGRRRRIDDLDRALHEAGRADALEVEVAREIVAAGPQRAQRRIEPRLHFDERADRRRHALLHRKPDTLGRVAQPALHLVDAHHDAVGALAFLTHFDVSRNGNIPGGVLQDGMRDTDALERDCGKAGGGSGESEQQRESDRPRTGENGRGCQDCHECQCRPHRRLSMRGKIDDDAEAETDRQPRHEPPGGDIGRKPARNDFARTAKCIGAGRPGNAARPRDSPCPCPTRPALRHHTARNRGPAICYCWLGGGCA
jgi:hypothetical protein